MDAIVADAKENKMEKKRILTGDRPTGRLHLGHYCGSLKNRVALQDEYEEFILIADVQALTTHFERPELIYDSIYQITMDNLSVGLDPEKVTFIQQSQVPSIHVLTMFYSMITTCNHLLINPTIKSEARNYGFQSENREYDFSKLTYGFLGYPVSQTADITFCNADLVPVGEDQIPHIEYSRRLVRRFNEMYGTSIKEPEYKLSSVSRLCGLDGNSKMGKSLGNAIYLSDTPDEVWSKIRNAKTDTNRISVKIPGNPDVCSVYAYHKAFNEEGVEEVRCNCTSASMGCVQCKKILNEKMNAMLDPIRERRHYYEEHKSDVRDIIKSGTKKANEIGNKNLDEIMEKMHIMI